MSSPKKQILLIFIIVFFIMLACSFVETVLTGQEQPEQEEVAAPETEVVEVAPVEATATSPLPTETATPEPTITPSPTVVHLVIPPAPPAYTTLLTDLSSKAYAAERRAIADSYPVNIYERPFTSLVMDYQPYLDIVRTELSVEQPWIFFTIFLEGEPPAGSDATYAVEIDLDQDGRGDWFISGRLPPSTSWTTDGVRAYRDSNNDVGGTMPLVAEAPVPGLDGYDEVVFDQGIGSDPDAAWIRRDPASANRIQLAFKLALLASPGKFLWGSWSDEGVRQPGWLDYNDHFTLAEAGSPASNSSDYPLKGMASLDNTCRWAYGFKPSVSLPGLCAIPVTPTSIPPTRCSEPPQGCPVLASVHLKWNPRTCQCEPPACPPQQCPPRQIWDPRACKCVKP